MKPLSFTCSPSLNGGITSSSNAARVIGAAVAGSALRKHVTARRKDRIRRIGRNDIGGLALGE